MTATHVDGTAVIADEPAPTRLFDRAGAPVYYRKIRRLLLADGRELFGCTQCDYTASKSDQVRPHLNKHRGRQQRPDTQDGDVDALLARLAYGEAARKQLAEMERDRDKWRRRARKAERELATIRRVLTPTP